MQYVALQFDDDRILVGAAQIASGRVHVNELFHVDVDLSDEAGAVNAVKNALASHRVHKAEAVVVVKRSWVEIRELSLPPAPDNELPDMVKYLARTEFGSLNDNWLLDFVPLSTDETAPRKVLASGLSPERQKQILKITEGAGLRVKHIVLRPLESYSLLHSQLASGKRTLIVDLGERKTDLIVSAGSNVVATRSVRVLIDEESNQAKALLAEIKRTAVSARSALSNREIEEVIIIGGSPIDEPLAEGVREQLNVQVSVVNPLDQVEVGPHAREVPHPANYSAILGSLYQQSTGKRHAIDYLNPRKPIIRTDGRRKLRIYGGLAAGLVALTLLWGAWTLRSRKNEITELNRKLVDLQAQSSGSENRASIEDTMNRVEAIDAWATKSVQWLDELHLTSKHFLTADDAIVDQYDGRWRPEGTTLNLRGKMATGSRSKLVAELQERYLVEPLGWKAEDQDPSYPEPYDFKITLPDQTSDHLKQIEELAKPK